MSILDNLDEKVLLEKVDIATMLCIVDNLKKSKKTLSQLDDSEIESLVFHYLRFDAKREREKQRYVSFDLCYRYFQSHRGELSSTDKAVEISCMYLWSYLASWGMLRNNGLINYSPIALKPLMQYLDKIKSSSIWGMDFDQYDKELVFEIFIALTELLGEIFNITPTITLVTKIMLGIFGCIPAFDRFFTKVFHSLNNKGFTSNHSLKKQDVDTLLQFYGSHKKAFDKMKQTIHMIDSNGKETKETYSIAKLIDMFGFEYGKEILKK